MALLPGELREALPSPDGLRLAVLGGPGTPDREHTVLVLERSCQGDLTEIVPVSTGARLPVPPEGVPVPYVHLAWSDDGNLLFAAGTVYELKRDGEGRLGAHRLFRMERPVLDFRFGPRDRAAAVELVEARERVVGARGRREFTITLAYVMPLLRLGKTVTIRTREKYGIYWVPRDFPEPPRVAWEPDGALLIYYPFQRVTERYLPGRARELVTDREPEPPPQPSRGPFRFGDPCPGTWELVVKDEAVRVRLRRK